MTEFFDQVVAVAEEQSEKNKLKAKADAEKAFRELIREVDARIMLAAQAGEEFVIIEDEWLIRDIALVDQEIRSHYTGQGFIFEFLHIPSYGASEIRINWIPQE